MENEESNQSAPLSVIKDKKIENKVIYYKSN